MMKLLQLLLYGCLFVVFNEVAASAKCKHKLDLGFILDASGSIGHEEFEKMKEFVNQVSSFFSVSSDHTRVSVMTFSNRPTIHIKFKDTFVDMAAFNNTVLSIEQASGGTNTADALIMARTTMFSTEGGVRSSGAKRVLILMTDGYSNSGMVRVPAQHLKNIGVVIFTVGLGSDVNDQELEDIASNNNYVMRLNDTSELTTLYKTLAVKSCNDVFMVEVRCGTDVIEVALPRSVLSKGVEVHHLFLEGHEYDWNCLARENRTHIYFNFRRQDCGMTKSEDDLTISYSNVVHQKNVTEDGVITRTHDFEARFTCSYDKKIKYGPLFFRPVVNKRIINIAGKGKFQLRMDFYETRSFSRRLSAPVIKSLQENIYIQYKLITSSTDLIVYAENCRAAPDNTPYGFLPKYYFIRNGCATDKTMRYRYALSHTQQFSIGAFKFLANYTFIYLHCDFVVCDRNNRTSPCHSALSCTSPLKRKRRSASAPVQGTKRYTLSAGPLTVPKSEEKKSRLSTEAFVGIGAGGVTGLTLILALVVVIKKRRRRTKGSDVSVVSYNENAMKNHGYEEQGK